MRDVGREVLGGIDREEFRLVYQPIVNLDKEKSNIIASEVLLRWDHGDLGNIPPGNYIGKIDGTRELSILSEWVLDEAIRQQGEWIKQGLNVKRLNINIDVGKLLEVGFVNELETKLLNYGVPEYLIGIEITEYGKLDRLEDIRGVIKDLQSLGVYVYLDDVNMREEDMEILTSVGVDYTKVSLVGVSIELLESGRLDGIIKMLGEMGNGVIIEGIEDKRMVEEISGLGYKKMQGYYFYRPLEKNRFISTLLHKF